MVLILGEVRRLRADPQEARSLAERGRTLSHPKDHGSQAQWRALLARLEAHEGRFDLSTGETVQMPTTGGLDADGVYRQTWSPAGPQAAARSRSMER